MTKKVETKTITSPLKPVNDMSVNELQKEIERRRHQERIRNAETTLLQNDTVRHRLTPSPAMGKLRKFYILNSALQKGKLATHTQFHKAINIFKNSKDGLRHLTPGENRIYQTITDLYHNIKSPTDKTEKEKTKEQRQNALIEFITNEKKKLYQEVGWIDAKGKKKSFIDRTEFAKEQKRLKQFLEKTSLPVLKKEMIKKFKPELVKTEKTWWESIKNGFSTVSKSVWNIAKWATSPAWAPIWLAGWASKKIIGGTINYIKNNPIKSILLGGILIGTPYLPAALSALGIKSGWMPWFAEGAAMLHKTARTGMTKLISSGGTLLLNKLNILTGNIGAKIVTAYKGLYGGLYQYGLSTYKNILASSSQGILPSLKALGTGAHEALAFGVNWLKNYIYAPLISKGGTLGKDVGQLLKNGPFNV